MYALCDDPLDLRSGESVFSCIGMGLGLGLWDWDGKTMPSGKAGLGTSEACQAGRDSFYIKSTEKLSSQRRRLLFHYSSGQ